MIRKLSGGSMMFGALSKLLRGEGKTSGADLQSFIAAESAFLTQRNSFEYCRARAGLNWQALFSEFPFRQGLEICRWTAYPAILSDMLMVVAGRLGADDDARARLPALYAAILAAQSRNAGRTDDWAGAIRTFTDRLADPQDRNRQPDEISTVGALVLFQALPIHPALRGHDQEMVVNSIRFGMVGFTDKLDERFPPETLAAALRSVNPPGGASA